ncbi:MAG: glycoside hydrolase family 57 protein [Clostridium sp.]
MEKGYVSIILHAHLPYIYHPENDGYLEETWLFEAISETYIPLLQAFSKLVEEKIDFRITMSLTPPLLSMLDNKILKKRYIKYLKDRIILSSLEVERQKDNIQKQKLAIYYNNRYKSDLDFFLNTANSDLISMFKHFQDLKVLEIITCGATHGYFPILYLNEKAVEAQIKVGVDTYKKYFNTSPRGIWLPECGYIPEADKYLKKYGIEYIITETHGILYADNKPAFSTFAPIVSNQGIVAFGRDLESSRQVWSSITGYPGDPNYRDFYNDIGYEAPYEYIKPYIANNGVRVHTGIKYAKITGNTANKEVYDIDKAREVCSMQASHFLESRNKQILNASKYTFNPPIIVCPYDAELYGHWWYEGPLWIYDLFKKIHYDTNIFKLITPSEYIDKYPKMQLTNPCRSSWGAKGYSEVWLNQSNDYAHKHLLTLADRMCLIANMFKDTKKSLTIRALNQLARELLLLQSSDWLFIITNGTMVEYAHKRIKDHTGRFNAIYEMILNNDINEKYIKDIEQKDNIFPFISFKIYADN